jgi:hypothetical protein
LHNYNFVSKAWKEEKERREFLYNSLKKKKLDVGDKFCSFLKNSLLPKASRYKFPFLLNNDKWDYLKFKQPKPNKFNKWTHNEEVTFILYSAYCILYFGFFFDFEYEILESDNEERVPLSLFLFNYSTFFYFLNSLLYELYIYNIDLKYFIYSYTLDLKYNNNYLFLFNYYIFSYTLNFFVLLNLGLIKYEHDKVLTPPEKWDEIPKMDLDFFDYSEFTDFNISNDILLNYQDNLFYSYCIYEFYLDFNFYFFNIFNLDFFHKLILKKKKKKLKFKYRSYLSKISYNEILNNKKENYDEFFLKNYDEFLLTLYNNNINKLDYYKNMMDIRSFMVKIPYLFFLMYTWYIIHYRNFRYNLYVRSYYFFEEYTCKKKIFILHNNPYGKNKTKVPFFKFQRLWTIDHFKFYIEERFFNKWFLFYSTRSFNLKNFFNNENLVNLYSFKNLLSDFNLNLLLKINKLENFEYIYEFYYDNLLDILDINRSIEGYKLAMRTKSSKFTRKFKLGRSSFLELDEFVEMMYTLPFDIYIYYRHINKMMSFDFILEMYNKKFINFYFLKDFYNLNNNIDHIKNYKMVNLYNKLIYLSFYIIDPFFLKYFWRKYFPRRLKKLWNAQAYLKLYLIQCGIRGNTRLNIFNYDFFHHYLNWRTDTSTSVQQNKFYKDEFSASLSISNIMVKSRFFNLLEKLKYILNLNNIFNMQKFQHFILLLKNYYTILLNQNIDFILYIFFFNINKFLNIQNNTNTWLHVNYMIDNNFIYRYYVYFLLFEFNYYIDWFNNKMKRVLWIFHKKDYAEHEGDLFYKSKYNEMF